MSSNGIVSSIQDFDELKESGFNENQARGILKLLSKDAASKEDLKLATTELKRDIKELDTKIETVKAELKRDIKELDTKIETVKAELKKDIETVRIELKRDIKELESKLSMKMIITSGGFAFAMLSALVTLAKLGLLSPPS